MHQSARWSSGNNGNGRNDAYSNFDFSLPTISYPTGSEIRSKNQNILKTIKWA